jgi:hypothetical protein
VEKSFYFIVNWSEAQRYKAELDEKGIPYVIQSPADLPDLKDGKLAIVFPSIPNRLYTQVRSLFTCNGQPYP